MCRSGASSLFPGAVGAHPSEPLTARLLGVDSYGNPEPGAQPSPKLVTEPGYSDSWFDVDTKTFGRA